MCIMLHVYFMFTWSLKKTIFTDLTDKITQKNHSIKFKENHDDHAP